MKYFYTIFLLLFIPALTRCSDTGNSEAGSSSLTGQFTDNTDTIVYSVPRNFLESMDTLSEENKYAVSSYEDMLELFGKLNYTPEAWQAGIREVPRIYLPIIGEKWGQKTSKEISVLLKKQLFFRSLAPLILRANELITKDRNKLSAIREKYFENNKLEDTELQWLQKLSGVYKLSTDDGNVTDAMLEELWKRVDIVPPSLALSQAAEESGWGTSRFAESGNAVYGQWTWGKNAIVPEQQRKELGNYGIAAFGSLQESVCAYMLNLNTHNAYQSLRGKRAELRKEGKKITGSILAEQLTRYSERGEEYVQTLKSLIDYNRLAPADDAYLSSDPPIYLVAASE